jgi:hypothetical protein
LLRFFSVSIQEAPSITKQAVNSVQLLATAGDVWA